MYILLVFAPCCASSTRHVRSWFCLFVYSGYTWVAQQSFAANRTRRIGEPAPTGRQGRYISYVMPPLVSFFPFRRRWVPTQGIMPINPFTPGSDQFKISPAASPKLLHHTVWRTWLFISYSDERWLCYKFLVHHLYISLLGRLENVLKNGLKMVVAGIEQSADLTSCTLCDALQSILRKNTLRLTQEQGKH